MNISSKKNKFIVLDMLKGTLIFLAIILHYRDFFEDSIRAFDILNNWVCLVVNPFFFAASGFGMIYAYRSRISDISFILFMKRRIIKLYPMYLITTIIMFVFTIHADGIESVKLMDIIQNLLLMTSGWFRNIVPYNIPAWFFSVLVFVYVIFWLTEKIFKSKDIYAFSVLFVLGIILMTANLNIPFLYYEDGLGISAFSSGVIIGIFYLNNCRIDGNEKKLEFIAGLLILISVLLFVFLPMEVKVVYKEQIFTIFIAPAVIILSLLSSVNLAAEKIPIITGTLAKSAMNLYLWHIIVVRVYNALCLRFGIYEIIGMKLAYILAIIVNFFVCLFITNIEKYVKKRICR